MRRGRGVPGVCDGSGAGGWGRGDEGGELAQGEGAGDGTGKVESVKVIVVDYVIGAGVRELQDGLEGGEGEAGAGGGEGGDVREEQLAQARGKKREVVRVVGGLGGPGAG